MDGRRNGRKIKSFLRENRADNQSRDTVLSEKLACESDQQNCPGSLKFCRRFVSPVNSLLANDDYAFNVPAPNTCTSNGRISAFVRPVSVFVFQLLFFTHVSVHWFQRTLRGQRRRGVISPWSVGSVAKSCCALDKILLIITDINVRNFVGVNASETNSGSMV